MVEGLPWVYLLYQNVTYRRNYMTVISLKDVHKKYPLGKTEVHAVQGVSFDIGSGDFISIAGPSGSGKSTILNMIGCIDTPEFLQEI